MGAAWSGRASQHPEPPPGGRGLGWLLEQPGASPPCTLRWTQSEEEQGWERANQSLWDLFQASGSSGTEEEEVYFKSCGCSSQLWRWPSDSHGLWCWVLHWACDGLKIFVERGLPARGENVEFSFSQPIKCMENKRSFFFEPTPSPSYTSQTMFELYQTGGG